METSTYSVGERSSTAQCRCDCRLYLAAKYYHYDPVELNDLADFNASLVNLIEEDNIATVENAVVDEYNLSVSIDENFKEL